MRALGSQQQPELFSDELRSQVTRSRQSVHCTETLFRPRNHRGTKAVGCDCPPGGLDRIQYPAEPSSGVRQNSYRAERTRTRQREGPRRVAEDAFSQERIAGGARLAAGLHEMSEGTR